MRTARLTAAEVVATGITGVIGAVLLAPVRLPTGLLAKGSRVDEPLATRLVEAARSGVLVAPLRLGWAGPDDMHEDEAALTLAEAVAGPGIVVGAPVQSRIDLSARTDGVLRVNVEALGLVNRIDPLEVFTLFHGQAVRSGRVVASVKVAPHLVWKGEVLQGALLARQASPVIDVDPYRPLVVAAIAAELLTPPALERFSAAARTKVGSLGGIFAGTSAVGSEDHDIATVQMRTALDQLVFRQRVSIVLVGGVSAGDPLSPFYQALRELGGQVVRRGVPAHPGSMIWLARLGDSTLLGLPQCGMFSMATAADLVLPRLLTGEAITAGTLADLGHGGLLGPEMRFRFPEYARDLEAPPA